MKIDTVWQNLVNGSSSTRPFRGVRFWQKTNYDDNLEWLNMTYWETEFVAFHAAEHLRQ